VSGNEAGKQGQIFELRDYVRVFRAYWLGCALIVLATLAIGGAWTITQPRVYSATSSGLVQAPTGDSPSMAYAADSLSKSKAESYVKLAASPAVASRVAKATGSSSSAPALLSRIQANLPDSTAIIEITASGASPKDAQQLADAWIAGISAQVDELESGGGAITAQATKFVKLAEAPLPTLPTSPNVQVTLLLAAIAGLILAAIYGLVRNHLDRRIRSAAEIERQLGVSVIGTIPASALLTDGQQLVSQQPIQTVTERHASFAIAESLRELRTNLSYVDVDNPPRVIVVTSPLPSDGKSTIAANVAEALAASGQRVIALDCDLRRPSLSKIFGVPTTAGLTDVLSGRAELNEMLQPVGDHPNLLMLGPGRIPPNPSEILGSRSFKELLAEVAEQAFVIIDAPPVLPVTDAAVLANSADGVLVVASTQRTTYDQLGRTLDLIRRGHGNVLGVVLNRVPTKGHDAKAYGYYGGSYYYTGDDQQAEPTAPAGSVPAGSEAATREVTTPEATAPELTVASPERDRFESRRSRRRDAKSQRAAASQGPLRRSNFNDKSPRS
jgi:capsular exopolysaccharide synthesis family protein